MPVESKWLFLARMDVDSEKEALFNEVYDSEHVPMIRSVPGVIAATRFRRRDLTLVMGGVRQTISLDNEPTYTAIYEIESPDVLLTEDWMRGSDGGRWPAQVRPFTRNKRLVLLERITS